MQVANLLIIKWLACVNYNKINSFEYISSEYDLIVLCCNSTNRSIIAIKHGLAINGRLAQRKRRFLPILELPVLLQSLLQSSRETSYEMNERVNEQTNERRIELTKTITKKKEYVNHK